MRGWALAESCRLFKNIFFCIFEASCMNFTHKIRGVRQYSRHINDFGGGSLSIAWKYTPCQKWISDLKKYPWLKPFKK